MSDRTLSIETITNIAYGVRFAAPEDIMAAFYACSKRDDVTWDILWRLFDMVTGWIQTKYYDEEDVLIEIGKKYTKELQKKTRFKNDEIAKKLLAISSYIEKSDISLKKLSKMVTYASCHGYHKLAFEVCKNRNDIPLSWAESSDEYKFTTASYHFLNYALVDYIKDHHFFGLNDCRDIVKHFAYQTHTSMIEYWFRSDIFTYRLAALCACMDRDDLTFEYLYPNIVNTLVFWVDDKFWADLARNLLAKYKNILPDKISDMLSTDFPNTYLEEAKWRAIMDALYVCDDCAMFKDILEKGLTRGELQVRLSAAEVNAKHHVFVPYKRTFEPPSKVYKKCCDGVIMVGEIPKDAEVRGVPGEKCRTNKIKITDICGNYFGESVGVSRYDMTKQYRVGDMVEVKNFDYSDEQCSTGYHFLCTYEEAKRFRL